MMKLAVIFESCPFDRKGLFNAVHNRVKHLAATGECVVDVYCVHSRDNALTRRLRHTPSVPSVDKVSIDGIEYRMMWYRFSILDHILLEKLHVRPWLFNRFMMAKVGVLKGYDPKTQLASVEQRNKMSVGEEIEIMKYIGAKDATMLRTTVRWTFIWSMGVAGIFMLIYHFAGIDMLKMMTSDHAVVEASREYLPWLLLMPVIGCAAFTWDGIYIGATASKAIRNSMLWAVVGFAAVWFIGILCLNHFMPSSSTAPSSAVPANRYGYIAMHILMAAYFAHLLARTLYLSARYRKVVLAD